jgi:hypothetical protein
MVAPAMSQPLLIGNALGFYGDRFGAMGEMLEGGPLDVLTGDYLAELTMLILGRSRMKDPGGGYATTFLRQMEECLGLAAPPSDPPLPPAIPAPLPHAQQPYPDPDPQSQPCLHPYPQSSPHLCPQPGPQPQSEPELGSDPGADEAPGGRPA